MSTRLYPILRCAPPKAETSALAEELVSNVMRAPARDTTALAVGSAANGILAYVFYVLATRHLGAEVAAPVSILWTYWSFAAAALTFPIQHWIARSLAAHRGDGAVRQALPMVIALVLVASLAVGLLAWLGRDALFHRGDAWFPALVAWVTVGSGLVGVARGSLSARNRFHSVGLLLAAENALRCGGAVLLIVAGVPSSVGFGICLAAGSLVVLLWPSALRFTPDSQRQGAESPLGLLGGAAGGQVVGQAIMTGGPVALALSGGTAVEVTALFAGLALFRAPYTLAVGLVSQLTGRLTRAVIEGRQAALRKVRISIVVAAPASAVAAGAVGSVAGPLLVRLVFGPQVRLGELPAALIAVGSALAMANLVLTIVIIAEGRGGALTRAWIIGATGGAACFWLAGAAPLGRVCWAFAAAEAVAFASLLVVEAGGSARMAAPPAGGPPPGTVSGVALGGGQ